MIKDKIISEINKLSDEMQKKVYDYTIKLQFENNGKSGKELLQFSGLINKEDLSEMKNSIEENCECIDYEQW